MGSASFNLSAVGRDADEIFKSLVKESREENGTRRYTGEICEKEDQGYTVVDKPKGKKADAFAAELLDRSSKFEPAFMFRTGEFREVSVAKVKKIKEVSNEPEGTKKWVTYYVNYINEWINGFGLRNTMISESISKVEAKKAAKAYAKEHQVDVYMAMEKRLEYPRTHKRGYNPGISNLIATFEAETEMETVRMPVWRVVGMASY